MLDFDSIDIWAPSLNRVLLPHVPETIPLQLAKQSFELTDDARELLFELADRERIIDATHDWIRSEVVVAYHGTRLTDGEVEAIRGDGLIPLGFHTRLIRLSRVLSLHPKWGDVRAIFETELEKYGPGERAGRREGQVHLTLSRSALLNRLNHYLKYGSEFDQNVAESLLGAEGKELLATDGTARIIHVSMPRTMAPDCC